MNFAAIRSYSASLRVSQGQVQQPAELSCDMRTPLVCFLLCASSFVDGAPSRPPSRWTASGAAAMPHRPRRPRPAGTAPPAAPVGSSNPPPPPQTLDLAPRALLGTRGTQSAGRSAKRGQGAALVRRFVACIISAVRLSGACACACQTTRHPERRSSVRREAALVHFEARSAQQSEECTPPSHPDTSLVRCAIWPLPVLPGRSWIR